MLKLSFCTIVLIFFWQISLPQTEALSEQLVSEIDSTFNKRITVAENFDLELFRKLIYDDNKMGFIFDGNFYESVNVLINNYDLRTRTLLKQELKVEKKDVKILNDTTAMVIASGDLGIFTLDNKSYYFHFGWTHLYQLLNKEWKIIHFSESKQYYRTGPE